MTKLSTMTNKTSKATTKVQTGSILSSYINKKRIAQAAIARALGVKSSTLAYYLKQTSIQTNTLLEISHILKRNFFMDIAQMLPDTYGSESDIFETHSKRIAALEEENKILKAEKAVLLESKK